MPAEHQDSPPVRDDGRPSDNAPCARAHPQSAAQLRRQLATKGEYAERGFMTAVLEALLDELEHSGEPGAPNHSSLGAPGHGPETPSQAPSGTAAEQDHPRPRGRTASSAQPTDDQGCRNTAARRGEPSDDDASLPPQGQATGPDEQPGAAIA